MGYNTRFEGYLVLSKPLTEKHQRWFDDWRTISKSYYDSDKLMEHYKGVGSLDGDYGENGEFFGYIPNELKTKDSWDMNEDEKKDYWNWISGENELMFRSEGKGNDYPSNLPSNCCKWKIEGDILSYDDSERFRGYIEWLEFIRTKILSKWGITFEDGGEIKWSGESVSDVGSIVYDDNVIDVERW